MSATFVVARREFLERVRSKLFVVVTLLGPLFMVGMVVVPAMIGMSAGKAAKLDIVDRSGTLGAPLAAVFEREGWTATVVSPATTEVAERARISANEINAYIAIPADALDGGEIIYEGDNAGNQVVQAQIKVVVHEVFRAVNADLAKLTTEQRARLDKKPNLLSPRLSTGEAGTSGTGAFLIGYFLALILYIAITLYGVAVMRSVVTEKSSRVMELMVAAVKPRSLMAGKILGVGGAGIIQVGFWLIVGAVTLQFRDELLGALGVANAGATPVPEFAVTEIAVALAFFVVGYFFYSSMYAAVGAMVSSEQETQQVQMPVTMLLIVGVVCLQVVSNAPRGSATTIMTNVPLWSPILMPMRYLLGGATTGEMLISLAILVASTLVIIRVAAKIYRVGVLMYGKRPDLRELVRWLRY